MMPFAAYGQGPVLVTPFKMARVAATVAAGGAMPQGRWIVDENNPRTEPPVQFWRAVRPHSCCFHASVVTSGTARRR